MRTVETSEPDTMGTDVSQRQSRLAETLRSIAGTASFAPEGATSAVLEATARRWETETYGPDAMASLLDEVNVAREAVADQLVSQPLLAARRVNVALGRVQAATSLVDVRRLAPAELCWAGDFDRVMLSRVEGSMWFPSTWHAENDSKSAPNVEFAELLRGRQLNLSNGMIETEVIRRRLPALVGDAASEPRTYPPLVEVAGCRSYVIAPIVAGDIVVGLLHADTYNSGRELAEIDRVTLRAFADGVGLILERLALLERLSSQRMQISAALLEASQAVDDLCTAPVDLMPNPQDSVPALHSGPDALPLDDGLTAREREVFAVLVSGATNAQIADRLTVSETTVKSHVKHILRKLRAANRAEAISRYLVMANKQTRSGF